jgi:hypothetical protein
VVAELDRLGFTPALRAEPNDPDIWWEKPAVSQVVMTARSD